MSAPIPFKLSDQALSHLALQVAMDIAPIEELTRQVGITPEFYDKHVKENPFFKKVLEQYTIEWNSVQKTPDRVKWKAQALIELGLSTLGTRMLDTDEALPAVTEAAKLVSRLAGVDSDKGGTSPGEKFTITINLGPDNTVTCEKEVEGPEVRALPQGAGAQPSVPAEFDMPGKPTPLLQVPEGEGGDTSTELEPEGSGEEA